MPEMHDFPLPPNLPRPIDDGATNHLAGMKLPKISLPSTTGRMFALGGLTASRSVIYCYPRTGVPGEPDPEGWDMIPGARGCTPQTCGFRDVMDEFGKLDAEVFGFSTQTTEFQKEMSDRLNVPFEILSDAEFRACDALRLPTFEVQGVRLVKRLTMIIRAGQIEHILYPVFPSNESAEKTLEWMRNNPLS